MDIARWIGVPVALVTLVFGGHWLSAAHDANARNREWTKQTEIVRQQEALTKSEQGRREYVLEVIGLGVTVDKYRQGALWNVLQKGSWHTTIRELDPNKYDWSAQDKGGTAGSRICDALENGAGLTPVYWGTPSFNAGAVIEDPAAQPSEIDPVSGMAGGAETSGVPERIFITAPWRMADRPDRLLEDVFAFFDEHPDVPYVALAADDTLGMRDRNRLPGSPPRLKDGHYVTEMPDSGAFFILARRERVEPLRPFVFDDLDENIESVEKLNSSGFARRLYLMNLDLRRTVKMPVSANKYLQMTERLPTVAEWLPAAAAFAQRPDIRGAGLSGQLGEFNPWSKRPPKDWKPTPWFPIPWNRFQMNAFDTMPSFGFIHRPTFVKFVDDDGKPVMRRDAREKILEAGWQQALLSLPEAERSKGPSRIIAAFGDKAEQEMLLDATLRSYAATGGPAFDSRNSAQFINTDRRLGNTGAATFFVQMAIGVMGSYSAGGASAAINLRDPCEASIILMTPPLDAKRKTQERALGDILVSRVGPSVDPVNYETPSVEAVINANNASGKGP